MNVTTTIKDNIETKKFNHNGVLSMEYRLIQPKRRPKLIAWATQALFSWDLTLKVGKTMNRSDLKRFKSISQKEIDEILQEFFKEIKNENKGRN